MAFAASVSLRYILEQFCISTDWFDRIRSPESKPILDHLHIIAFSMRDFDFDEVRPAGGESLEKQIRDALWRAEDVVESYWLSLLHSSESDQNFFQDIQEVVQEIESGMERMKKFAHDHKQNSTSVADVLSSIDYTPPQCNDKIVGLDQELEELKGLLLHELTQVHCLRAFVIHGMGGIGKTLLATTFYNDSDVRNYFSIGAWVKVSLRHCVRHILLSILNTMQVFGRGKDEEISSSGLIQDNINDEGLENIVRERLANERYLVVVDCLCQINFDSWNYIKSILPYSNNGSRIILVNRRKIPRDEYVFGYFAKRFLDTSHSWELLREKVFGDEPFPYVFERIGKKIAQNCEGLPLAIITVGSHLAKKEKTVEYWNKITDSRNSIAYSADGAPMFEQLYLSYKQLPQILRPVFLYLSVFPERYQIDLEKSMTLMISEGLFARNESATVETLLRHLIDCHLVLLEEGKSIFLHHTLWHLCRNLAQKDEFFHVMNIHNDWEDFPPSMNTNNVRRLVVSKNVLLGVVDIFKLEDSILSGIRSILLTGPEHPYPLTINWSMYKMLRVLDGRSIRFYGFPVEILSLVLLRHLAVTLNRVEVPPEISRLRNLSFLILLSRTKVVSYGEAPSYLPMDIWEMRQLMHLTAEGCDLPVPPHSEAQLPHLTTLHGVSSHSCTKEVLERIPNLMKLGIVINLAPKIDVDAALLRPFDHLIHLQQLGLLVCEISNPYFEGYPQPQLMSMPDSIDVSMKSLTFLNLSGCGLPWMTIEPITQLPALIYLHLQCQAFQGPKWELSNDSFKKLKVLVLEELDLVYWTARSREIFRCLEVLSITRCHKLQQIPVALGNWGHLLVILVEDSSREAETWARSIQLQRLPKRGRSAEISSPRGTSRRTN